MKYKFSYWEYESFLKDIDVIIIGSGIVGLSSAIHLKTKNPSQKVVVLERGPLPIGASTRNAGFACIGSMTEILDDLKSHTENEVLSLVEKRFKGLSLLRKTLGDENIKYRSCGGFEIFNDQEQQEYEECLDYMSDLNSLLIPITGHQNTFRKIENSELNFSLSDINNLIINEVEGSIHTGEMMKSWLKLAKGLGVSIINGVTVGEIIDNHDGVKIQINDHLEISAKTVILATNGLAKNLTKEIQILPARNQVLLTSVIPNLKLNGTFHYQKGYVYFRNIDGRVLIGGFRHLDALTEETTKFGQTDIIQNALEKFLSEIVLKNHSYQIENSWSGIMGVGVSKEPVIKKISENCVSAVRLGGMGVAIGSLVGKEAADLAMGN